MTEANFLIDLLLHIVVAWVIASAIIKAAKTITSIQQYKTMTRIEIVEAFLKDQFAKEGSFTLLPELTGRETTAATIVWKDGVPSGIRVPLDFDTDRPFRWVVVMAQDGEGAPNLRIFNPDFYSRAAIYKQARDLGFGRPTYIRYFQPENIH